MECRKLELTLVSANSLPDVRSLGRMKIYAKVWVTGESKTSKKTPTDMEGETNPRWNFTVGYMVTESAIRQSDSEVTVKLFCKRTLGDRFVGEVNLPIKSLFDTGLKAGKVMSYHVSGTCKGRLNILYSFGETVLVRKPSGLRWKNAVEVGFLVLLGGVILLLGDKGNDDDSSTTDRFVEQEIDHGVHEDHVSRDVHVVEDAYSIDDDGFYDC